MAFWLFKSHAPTSQVFFFYFILFKAKLFIMSLFHSDKEHLVIEIKMMRTHLILYRATSLIGLHQQEAVSTLTREHKKNQIKTVYFHHQKLKGLYVFFLFVILYVDIIVLSYSCSQDLYDWTLLTLPFKITNFHNVAYLAPFPLLHL